jgi:hypothetical protein
MKAQVKACSQVLKPHRPRSSTATTPRSSRCSRTGPTARWLTCLREVHRQRRLAGPRRDQPQPAPRRRIPGQPGLRQGPRRHYPPQPDRRRRPHRPARPRPHHLAPARGLAPRARMDHPAHRCLRPAGHSGLTSPDPVTAPRRKARRHTPSSQKPRASRKNSERQESRTLNRSPEPDNR